MRYSLRTLLIAVALAPLLFAAVFWFVRPEPGSPEAMREFLLAIDTSDNNRIEWAARNCFVIGSRAKAYESAWGNLPQVIPTPFGAKWVFSTKGDFIVVVAIGGNPAVVRIVEVVGVVN